MIICPHCHGNTSRVKETKTKRMEDCLIRYRTCLCCYKEFRTHERVVQPAPKKGER